MCECYKEGHSGDGSDLVSTLCKYDLRKGNLYVMSWESVRRMKRRSISSYSSIAQLVARWTL